MFQSGQQIGSYTLLRKLGRGGFGEVWLAEKRSQFVTKKVAVKLPLDDQINFDAIRQEAELWEQASGHANVLPIIDADIVEGQVVIVSEFADGGSLHDKLRNEGKLPIKQAVEMTIGILNGLEFLHHRKILHRDIKPQNILLQGNTPRLADFGISRAMQTTAISSKLVGTDAYMSPESFDGKRSVQTDIWSVGVVLYQLLVGNLPFPQEHPSERIFAILTKEFPPLTSDVPQSLQQIVAKSLAKQPENRYQTAGEMREELNQALVGIEHPTLAKTEVLHLPISSQTVTDVTNIEALFKTEEPEKETVQTPIIIPPIIQSESVQTQYKQAQFTEHKPPPTEAQEFADATQGVELRPTFYRFGTAILIGVAGLLIVVIVASIALAPRNTSQSKNVSNVNLSSTALMNIELKKLDNIPLVIKVDGRDESDPDSPPRTSFYAAQSNFTFKYGVYSVDKVQLKINGKIINLPRTPPLGDYMIHFEVTKDNLNQILQNSSNANVNSGSNVNSSLSNVNLSNTTSFSSSNSNSAVTGLVKFKDNSDKAGYKDSSGKIIIEPKYEEGEDFSEGLIPVKLNGKWGYIDEKGNVIIPFNYQDANSFSEGLAAVRGSNGNRGFIDKTGKVVIPFKYYDSSNFENGYAYVWTYGKTNRKIRIDKNGNVR